jgi:alpha-beta hydrolase superfamily lysophospholipase
VTIHTGLLQAVENTIKHEHDLSPNRPIYLVGDSFGGCLAVATAAQNPQIDLVLILVNPGR